MAYNNYLKFIKERELMFKESTIQSETYFKQSAFGDNDHAVHVFYLLRDKLAFKTT